MKEQNYTNHRKIDPPFHFVLSFLLLFLFIGTIINFIRSIHAGDNILLAVLLIGFSIASFIIMGLVRTYPLKAQDRAIRAEENLRHYVLTGKLLDPKLHMKQIIALRFAQDDQEYIELCEKAVSENISSDNIKKMITNWKADYHRL